MVKEIAVIALLTISTFLGNFNGFNLITKENAGVNSSIEFASKNIEYKNGNEEQVEILISHLKFVDKFLNKIDVKFKIISNEDMEKEAKKNNTDSFSGLYNVNKKEILIVGYDKDSSVHEVGHAVYYQLLNKKDTLKIKDLFNKEASGLIDSYGKTSDKEFFAVAFTEYIYSPKTLAKNCPQTFNFLKNIENKLK